jgi:alpha-tubulin suppressor-like RCC1 family protein
LDWFADLWETRKERKKRRIHHNRMKMNPSTATHLYAHYFIRFRFSSHPQANFFEGYKIRNLVSVSNHSMVLTDHDAYAWGNNDKGQLGFGDVRNRSIPTKLVLDTGMNAREEDKRARFSIVL